MDNVCMTQSVVHRVCLSGFLSGQETQLKKGGYTTYITEVYYKDPGEQHRTQLLAIIIGLHGDWKAVVAFLCLWGHNFFLCTFSHSLPQTGCLCKALSQGSIIISEYVWLYLAQLPTWTLFLLPISPFLLHSTLTQNQ